MPTRAVHPRRLLLAFAVLVGALGACESGGTDVPAAETAPSDSEVAADDGASGEGSGSDLPVYERIPDIVREVEPSVVAILTDIGEGSGVVWDADGTIVTNHHVVDGATRFEVAFADGNRSPAELVASDPLTDLALLRADRTGLPAAEFATALPEVGELAIAIGNPLGFENTVTAGIVSGLQRSIPGTAPATQSLIDLLQTDAPISPGNSGGALVDGEGQVIGINVAYLPPSARAVSIGFAIPAPVVTEVVDQLLEDGTVSHPYLGLRPAPLTPQIREQLGAEVDEGVVVIDVSASGPAAEAGLRPGDVIVALEEQATPTVESFLAALRRRDAGDIITIDVRRDGEELTLEVSLGDRSTVLGG